MTTFERAVEEQDSNTDSQYGRRVLEALRVYQAADSAMRRRTRQAMSMGENEVLVLRFLIRAATQERTVTPTDIARYLGISTASTTALIDRLEQSGHIARTRHPTDRRSVIISATVQADDEVRTVLGEMDHRMMAATRGLTDAESEIIVAFLERMQAAADDVAASGT